jgi:glycosyltransferase involved in cell wall biosynthesis
LGGNGHKRPLRILHIDPEKNWGGGEAQVLGLVSYLAGKQHRSTVLAPPEGALWARLESSNVERRPLVVRNELDFVAAFTLRQILVREPFDIVHFHTKRAHALALWAPHGPLRPRYVVTRRMDYPLKKNWYTNTLYNDRVDLVIAISKSISEVLIKGGIHAAKIRVVPSGIDVDRFRQARSASADRRELVIGSLAVMEERKGQSYLIDAARLLRSRGRRLRYVFAGDGSLRTELQRKVRDSGLQEEIEFAGWIEDVPAFFSAIDIFVMPSLFEGLGIAALEAMAAAKPVIATTVGGLAESVVHEETGLLIPPRDPAALADAIERLAANPAVARALGERGAYRAGAEFSLSRMAAGNEACYYTVLNQDAGIRPSSGAKNV